jgi:hypothetical protein
MKWRPVYKRVRVCFRASRLCLLFGVFFSCADGIEKGLYTVTLRHASCLIKGFAVETKRHGLALGGPYLQGPLHVENRNVNLPRVPLASPPTLRTARQATGCSIFPTCLAALANPREIHARHRQRGARGRRGPWRNWKLVNRAGTGTQSGEVLRSGQ